MNKKFQDLDYSEFISYLSGFAQTVYGKKSIESSIPVFNSEKLADNLRLTEELFHILEASELAISPLEDIDPVIKSSKNGVLSPEKIQLIIDFQSAIGSIQINCNDKYIRAKQFLEELKPIENLQILSRMIKDGKIRRDATSKLASIISKIENLKKRIYQKLRTLVRGLKQSDIISTEDILIRQDRYCIMVKAAKRHLIKGMLIDVSGSGASMFVDPDETIELNNLLVMYRAKEKEEKSKILHTLTERIRHNGIKLTRLANQLGTLDKISAFYRYSVKYGCLLPQYKPEKSGFFLKNARHPLLVSLKNNVVANNIKQINKIGMIISGPNAGGKTVLLKTIGLSILAFYSSIPIPVGENSWIGYYDKIFTIFGNKENLIESLSNFSSKLMALKNIFTNATNSSLALIDEIADGTDPDAGANLAIAIFEELVKKEIRFISSTHLARVSLWALTEATSSIEIAGASFDKNTLMPTYKLEYGKIAESHTLDIANRFLPKTVVAAAAEHNAQPGTKFIKELIKKIDIYKKKQNKLEAIIEKRQKELEAIQIERKRWSEEKENIRKQKADEIERIIKSSEEKIRSLKSIPEIHREIAKLKQMAEKADSTNQTKKFFEGETVKIRGSSIQGKIIAIKANKIKIISSGNQIWVDKKEAIKVESKPEPPKQQISYHEANYQLSCNLIGMHIDEAREKLIRFLDDAILNGVDTVMIIHGIGTGALKKMTTELLMESNFIDRIRTGKPAEGGNGVTIARLK